MKVSQCDFMENPDLYLEGISTRVKAFIHCLIRLLMASL
jgi:hypothetical protein